LCSNTLHAPDATGFYSLKKT